MDTKENIQLSKNSLIIDACGREEIKICIEKNNQIKIIFQSKVNNFKNENILLEIVESLNKINLDLNNISVIYCCAGPGSYVGMRTIAIIVNTITQENKLILKQFSHDQGYSQAEVVKKISPIYPIKF